MTPIGWPHVKLLLVFDLLKATEAFLGYLFVIFCLLNKDSSLYQQKMDKVVKIYCKTPASRSNIKCSLQTKLEEQNASL